MTGAPFFSKAKAKANATNLHPKGRLFIMRRTPAK
jgi:hypothetical protein